jgi:hypothetical protein
MRIRYKVSEQMTIRAGLRHSPTQRATFDAEMQMAWALAHAQPAGLAGAVALLRHAGEFEAGGCGWPCDLEDPEDEDGDKWTIIFHHSLAAALEAMMS